MTGSARTGRRSSAAVLLLHGLTGTPLDVRSVEETLTAAGYDVSVPLLPGRGTCPSDMYRLRWEDWMCSALDAYDELARDHDEVIVGGLSAGGTMALDVALRRQPAALLLYATALAIGNRFAYLAPYVWRIIREWPSPPTDLLDLSVGAKCYDPAPVRAVAELIAGIGLVRGRLTEIACPAFIAHSVSDRLVPIAHARYLAQRLRGPVQTLFLEGTGHAITVDIRRREVAEASLAFLQQTFTLPELRTA